MEVNILIFWKYYFQKMKVQDGYFHLVFYTTDVHIFQEGLKVSLSL